MTRKYNDLQILKQLANREVEDGDTPEARVLWNIFDLLYSTAANTIEWDNLFDAVAAGLTGDQILNLEKED